MSLETDLQPYQDPRLIERDSYRPGFHTADIEDQRQTDHRPDNPPSALHPRVHPGACPFLHPFTTPFSHMYTFQPSKSNAVFFRAFFHTLSPCPNFNVSRLTCVFRASCPLVIQTTSFLHKNNPCTIVQGQVFLESLGVPGLLGYASRNRRSFFRKWPTIHRSDQKKEADCILTISNDPLILKSFYKNHTGTTGERLE